MKRCLKKYESPYARGYAHHPKIKAKNDKAFIDSMVSNFLSVREVATVTISHISSPPVSPTAGIDLFRYPLGMVRAKRR